jgi:hypothetical protein
LQFNAGGMVAGRQSAAEQTYIIRISTNNIAIGWYVRRFRIKLQIQHYLRGMPPPSHLPVQFFSFFHAAATRPVGAPSRRRSAPSRGQNRHDAARWLLADREEQGTGDAATCPGVPPRGCSGTPHGRTRCRLHGNYLATCSRSRSQHLFI